MSTDIEYSPKRLDEIKLIAASGDESQLAQAGITDLLPLTIEVARLRQELFEAKERIKVHLKRIGDLEGLTATMRPEFRAQEELADLRNRVSEVISRADANERALEAKEGQLKAAERRIESLVAGMTEMARSTGNESQAKLQAEVVRLERENGELRERIARMEQAAG